MRVRFTLPALADLEDALRYIAINSPQGAQHVRTSIEAAETLLGQFPKSGVQTRIPWLRRLKVTSYLYVILYEATESEVIIHAVRHSARDPRRIPGH